DLRLPAHGVEMLEPGRGKARRMQQQSVDVQQLAATPAAQRSDEIGELRMVLLLDQADARHGRPSQNRSMANQPLRPDSAINSAQMLLSRTDCFPLHSTKIHGRLCARSVICSPMAYALYYATAP